jgi:hypothetical protein
MRTEIKSNLQEILRYKKYKTIVAYYEDKALDNIDLKQNDKFINGT